MILVFQDYLSGQGLSWNCERDVFELLHQGGWLDAGLLASMKNMVGFKNIAVHGYQTLQMPITVSVITRHLGDFVAFSSAILRKDGNS